jgi:hypothetical protein
MITVHYQPTGHPACTAWNKKTDAYSLKTSFQDPMIPEIEVEPEPSPPDGSDGWWLRVEV